MYHHQLQLFAKSFLHVCIWLVFQIWICTYWFTNKTKQSVYETNILFAKYSDTVRMLFLLVTVNIGLNLLLQETSLSLTCPWPTCLLQRMSVQGIMQWMLIFTGEICSVFSPYKVAERLTATLTTGLLCEDLLCLLISNCKTWKMCQIVRSDTTGIRIWTGLGLFITLINGSGLGLTSNHLISLSHRFCDSLGQEELQWIILCSAHCPCRVWPSNPWWSCWQWRRNRRPSAPLMKKSTHRYIFSPSTSLNLHGQNLMIFSFTLMTQSLLVRRLINEVLKSLLLYKFDTCKKTLITSSVSSFTDLLYWALAMHSHFLSFFVHSH